MTPGYPALDFWDLLAVLLTLTALFSYLNDRWLKQPTVIGIMLVAGKCFSIFIKMIQSAAVSSNPQITVPVFLNNPYVIVTN